MSSGERRTADRRQADHPPRERPALSSTVSAVQTLGRLAGNRATTALVQRARDGVTPPTVTADAAAQAINTWIQANEPSEQETNYSVGVARNGDLYISKVGGVTAGTRFVGTQLAAFIVQNGYQIGRDIYLAQQFNTAYTSGNHAEMCVMAAAGAGALAKIYCAAPHCAFCAEQMTKDNVTHGAAVGGHDQVGWAHPFAPIFLGSQVWDNTGAQLAALQALPLSPTKAMAAQIGVPWLPTSPKGGKRKAWL